MGPLLEANAVRKRFAGVTAVDGVDLAVARGEAVAVIGPNGAGKSTLLKLVAGVHAPDDGTILFAGRRLDGIAAPRVARGGVAMAHQTPRPFRELSVRENVRLGALHSRHGERPAFGTVDDILARCGLAGQAQRPAGALQLLDLKRLELAKALSLQPDLLLLDEIAAGLVGDDLDLVIDLIRDIHEAGTTLIVVEHVERVVRELVERVVVLDWGRQIAEGTPAEIARDETVQQVYLGTGHTQPRWNRVRGYGRCAHVDPSLRLSGVTAGYGGLTALRDVDLEVAPAEVVAVLGANGAGKTTLGRVVSGLTPVRSGSVTLGETDLTHAPPYVRARLGIAHCQEGRRLFPGLSVRETIELAAQTPEAKRHLRRQTAWVLSLFPALADRLDQQATTLSGGQQQMVAIACALISKPRVAVLDEISLGLAPVVVDALYEALAEISAAGIGLVIVEQHVARCLAIADRAYVLDRGSVSFVGDPAELADEDRLRAAYFGGGPSVLEAVAHV